MNGRMVLLGVGAVTGLLVVCGGGLAGGLSYLNHHATTGPRAAADVFLGELERGDTTGAYGSLCRTAKAGTTADEFTAMVDERPPASHSMAWTGSYLNDNGIETSTVSASITYRDGSRQSRPIPLYREAGTWKVCGSPF